MFSKIREIFLDHIKNNSNRYLLLALAFIVGVSAGAFTVNGLSSIQRYELKNYFEGYLQLLDFQKVDNNELLKISLVENAKIICALWILGVTVIGIPFIFALVGIRGFITGFSSGFIIKALGFKGILFTLFTLFPKEIIVIPCIIALGVNGINFSSKIIKNKSIKYLSKESFKANFAAYCFVTMFYSCFIFVGILLEAYVIPVFTRIIAPIITN